MNLKTYDLSIDERFKEEAEKQGKKLGWNKTAFTNRPAIKVKGLLYTLETAELYFRDDEKMRLAAPLIIPMENFRRGEVDENGKREPDYKTRFTPEFIEDVHGQLMSDPDKLKDFFNLEHGEEKVPAYIREIWIVENPETDKSNTIYGVKVPKGTLFAIAQITDRDYYEKLKADDVSGFSIEGFWGFDVKMSEEAQEYGDLILLNSNNEMLVLKRTDEDELEPGKFSLPGGKIEPGEDVKTGALRELAEETGIIIQDAIEVEAVENEDGTTSHYFTAKTQDEPLLSSEHTAFKWLKAGDIDTENLIFGQNERFKQLYQKAVKLITQKMENKLPEGEHEINGKIYVIDKDGNVIEVKEKAAAEEMAEDKPTEENDKETGAEEMAEDAAPAEEGAPEVKTLTAEEIKALVMETCKPMIDEAMRAVIEEVTKNEAAEEVAEGEAAPAAGAQQYSEQMQKEAGAVSTFEFLKK